MDLLLREERRRRMEGKGKGGKRRVGKGGYREGRGA